MKTVCLNILVMLLSIASLTACHDEPQFADTPTGNFEALWSALDRHYCFFQYKNVDWQEVHDRYAAKISNSMTLKSFSAYAPRCLKNLKTDTPTCRHHSTRRATGFGNNSRKTTTRLVEEHYLHFDYRRTSGISYRILDNNYAYMRYPSFSYSIGEGNLDNVLATLALADGLIVDVRDNGGGIITNAETLVARFIDKRILAGYISHKTGSGHDDFSEPYAYYIDPAKGRVHWTGKPIAVLTNRSTYSAANNFVSIMKSLPNVVVVGDATGGGCGMPFTSELPNGWSVRFSAAPIYDADRQLTEFGVQPTDGCQTDMTDADRQRGVDTIIERAFEALTDMQR